MNNALKESGKPLFFKVADPAGIGFSPPASRRGHSVRLAVRALGGMQKEALVASSVAGAAWRLASDEGAYLAGLDEAPCPLAFLTTGMVASYMNEIRALAKQRAIALRHIRLVQDNYYTMKGSALKGTMIGGAKDVELEAQIDSDADADTLRALVCDAVSASPLNGLMRGVKSSLFTLTHNGRALAPARVAPLAGSALPDPGDRFDPAKPASGDWSSIVTRHGMSPQLEHSTTSAGDSLKDEQDRLLHLRGIGTLRRDGITHVEEHQYNPRGSIFHFLSEEGAAGGGQGRAPDAASYISAGIGFCFMTQFGRFAKIAKKELREYRILQDTHFSLGGASGGTARSGEADAVETHVYLDTGEDDVFARDILDMAEQTCFLHAFCRTDLKARVRISRQTAAAA
ncbi:MAG: OsmC family protein [Proteobacteria bacterium]|nr:OsmC family protein [Pseudomonadota bacterium]